MPNSTLFLSVILEARDGEWTLRHVLGVFTVTALLFSSPLSGKCRGIQKINDKSVYIMFFFYSLTHTFPLVVFVISYLCFRDPKTRVWLAVISSCGMPLIQTPLSLSRSFMTMQRSSGRTMGCGPAGKGPTNINSSTVHSSESLSFFYSPFLYFHLHTHSCN